MNKRFVHLAVAAVLILTLAVAYQPVTPPASAQIKDTCRTFSETGKTVCGRFLQYWDEHGGLAQQGYPISGEFREVSEIDGKAYTVQYFERAVFELHPEVKAPFDVMLSLLGTITMKQRYPDGPPAPPTAHAPEACGQYFAETKQYVCGEFLDYWKTHGGLAQQGYPISGTFPEKSSLDGKLYTVQYFERAVFELHPENKAPYNVLLTQLGTQRFREKYPNGEPAPGGGSPLQVGSWGGQHVTLDVRADGAHFEFDCAHADVSAPLAVDSAGKLDMQGKFVQEHGGPALINDEENARPVRLTGTLNGNTLTVTFTYTDTNAAIGTYTLTLGADGIVRKCL